MDVKKYEKFFRKCAKIEKELVDLFPNIDPHDLHLIVRNILMPKKWGKRFLLKKVGKKYVP